MIEIDIFVAWTEDWHALGSTAEEAVETLIASEHFEPGMIYRVAQFNASLPLPGVEIGGRLTGERPHLQLVS